ncbi:MAG: hypothetical protein KatS3mg111_0226 [Pirellulaceae bacterium]|nr:MAG: hypothetical protein KatS3mg111_0226 [Pirellulaceae bacterium]
MELSWRICRATSAWHWAISVARGRVANRQAADPAVAELLSRLELLVVPLGVTADRWWQHVLSLASQSKSPDDLVHRLLTSLTRPEDRTPTLEVQLLDGIQRVEAAFARTFPRFDQEMPMRIAPLQAQWETFGPGLVRQLVHRVGADVLAECAELLLVPPVVGGAGTAHWRSNRVHFEAVLTNPHPELPEVVRLVWLLAQLDLDRPVFREANSGDRLPDLGALAMIPPVIESAAELGLCERGPETIGDALRYWDLPQRHQPEMPDVLRSWWETFTNFRPSWAIGLVALERMLSGVRPDAASDIGDFL